MNTIVSKIHDSITGRKYKKTTYEAKDGKVFDSLSDCILYESCFIKACEFQNFIHRVIVENFNDEGTLYLHGILKKLALSQTDDWQILYDEYQFCVCNLVWNVYYYQEDFDAVRNKITALLNFYNTESVKNSIAEIKKRRSELENLDKELKTKFEEIEYNIS